MELRVSVSHVILLCITYINAQDCNYCNCNTSKYWVPCDCTKIYNNNNCTSSNIFLFSPEPFIFPPDVTPERIDEIIIHDSMLTIKNVSFSEEMENLKKLTIHSCNTTTIDQNSFINAETLTELTVEDNNLLILDQDTFQNMSELISLTLKKNFIKDFSENLLRNQLNLKHFNLGNNRIQILNSRLFVDNKELVNIYLFENNIKDLPKNIFNGLTKVKEINLRNNKIQALPDGIFSNLQNLQEIDLQNNEIKSIGAGVFEGSSQLKKLNLDGNNMQNIDYNILVHSPQLKYMSVLNSSITCDCKFRPFFSIYEKKDISGNIYCSSPNILLGKEFSELTTEDFVCAPEILNCSKENNENITIISCKIYSDPLPGIYWTINDSTVLFDNELYNINSQPISDDIIWSNLTVLDLSESNSGLYEIEVRNNGGNRSKNYYLTYEHKHAVVFEDYDEPDITTAPVSTSMIIIICINVLLLLAGMIMVAACIYWKMNYGKLGNYNVQDNEFQDQHEACSSRIDQEASVVPKEYKVNPVQKPPRTFIIRSEGEYARE